MAIPKKGPRRLTPAQVAERLGISVSLVYQLIQEGRLPHIRVSDRRFAIDEDELEQWEAARQHTAEAAIERGAERDLYR